ncbi:hypothetical protein BBJ28_00024934, partial [Nothophytophthora sp. Chile5]
MADSDQGEDDYGDDDYEAESPARSHQAATPPVASPRERQPSSFSDNGLSADESDGRATTPRREEFQLGGGNTLPVVSSIRDQKVAPHRRSGLIEEVKWLRSDGKLQWTFPMEKFRRLKATPDLPERWLKLQNSPFGGEIQISTAFSPVEVSPSKEATALAGVPACDEEKVSSTRQMENTARKPSSMGVIPTVMTGEVGEYLRIGDSNGTDVFVISVFVRTALNLVEMVQAAMGARREAVHGTGFWLSYSFFDVVVQTDVFFDLEVAEFPPIRDSFRVQSCVQDLKLFLEGLGNLTVFLCTENKVLAGVEIPLRDLLEKELFSAQTADSRGPKPGEAAMTDGSFSFPDFENTVVTASVGVEFVQSQEATLDTINRDSELVVEPATVVIGAGQVNNKLAIQAQNDGKADDEGVGERVAFTLDHLRLSNAVLAPFAGQEGVAIELSVGDREVANGVMPCAFLKRQTLATNPSVQVCLENTSKQNMLSQSVHVRCFSSTSKHVIASSPSSATHATMIQDDDGWLKSVTLPLYTESNEPVVDSDSFVVSHKGEVSIPNLGCTFELLKDLLELKREMESSITIELRTEDAERCVMGSELFVHLATMAPNLHRVDCHSRQAVGNAVFSLNYLFFSEERFSCSETTCEQTFRTQAETEIHWLEAHSESALPDAQVGSEVYAHAYRSCSISIPVTALKGESGTNQPPHRLGSIRVVAFLEDVGPVIDTETGYEKPA